MIQFGTYHHTSVAWALPYLPVRLTGLGVRLTHALPHAASGMTSFVAGVESVQEAPPIAAIISSILGSIVGTKTGRVWLLKTIIEKLRF